MTRFRLLHWRVIKPIHTIYRRVLKPIYCRKQERHLIRVVTPNSTLLPPWALGYVPQPSNYDVSLLSNCYNPFVRYFIVWQAEIQKQKRKLSKKFDRKMQPSMENRFEPVDKVKIKAQEEEEQHRFWDDVPGDDDGNGIKEPGCFMSTVVQEHLTPVYLPWDCFAGYVGYKVVPTPELETTNLCGRISEELGYTSMYLAPQCVMFPVEQEQHISDDFSRESFPGYDDDHVLSPAHEVTICDDDYYDNDATYAYQQLREQREIVEERQHTPIYAWEMPREM